GSYILVSHDRYFISKTANKIWEIVDHKIKEFNGGYEEYAEWSERTRLEKERMSRESGVRSLESKKSSELENVESRLANKEEKKFQKNHRIGGPINLLLLNCARFYKIAHKITDQFTRSFIRPPIS